ncbi:type II CAAX endopeptidase family protein [Staphylococcus aureus]|uniref:CPBP family intramembrane glutamic endopeptidase n=2 Tax=Staphylococcus aureus TaxID=1280 RepID=UPI000AEE3E9F|nr:type II CAAX endopeptidase family protein [Staphylococcus aureus]MDG6650632.1 type II CAAX endopeptidase family protein [Staphylococcus aureus]MDG6653304.1 type II CAAX endopeptidase family protein [Staphylococcus aureus]MDG6658530.1 type II CAAX endopeptidase family protein [Staphylococcus aureus]MDG6663816.1 type II CAAX endopeptidase family protein [Staphylococcus aureus]MDG6666443.1 type II CAAX endopeptidase family protein [Staphylococcus aureus]
MLVKIKSNLKKMNLQDVYLAIKLISLVILPFFIISINEHASYHKGININYWVFGVLFSTIVALLIYKSFYMPIGYKINLDNKSFIIALLGSIFLHSGGWLISWLNNFELPENQKAWESIWNKNQDQLHYYIIDSVVVAPVIEEVIFRGVLFFAVYMMIKELKKWRKWNFRDKTNQYITIILFILVSALLFSSIHLSQSFLMSLPYLFAGITLAIIFVITKNLLVTIAIHALNNFINFNHINEIQTYKLLSMLLIISIIVFIFSNIKEKSHS